MEYSYEQQIQLSQRDESLLSSLWRYQINKKLLSLCLSRHNHLIMHKSRNVRKESVARTRRVPEINRFHLSPHVRVKNYRPLPASKVKTFGKHSIFQLFDFCRFLPGRVKLKLVCSASIARSAARLNFQRNSYVGFPVRR